MSQAESPAQGQRGRTLEGRSRAPIGARSSLHRTAGGKVLIRPPLRRQSVEGYVLLDNADLDRAGDCSGELGENTFPYCAYLTPVYSTPGYAREAAPAHAARLAERITPWRVRALTEREPISLTVCRIEVSRFLGRDYRRQSCGLSGALEELREGDGSGPAWRELRDQLEADRIDGALLQGGFGTNGQLFLFLAARERIRAIEVVDELDWRAGEAATAG
jgi:hypothetical protein